MAETNAPSQEVVYDSNGAPTNDLQQAQDATTRAALVTACLVLRNGATTFNMNVEVDVNANPPQVRGGRIISGICGSPWWITGGTVGSTLVLTARRAGPGDCTNTLTIIGSARDLPPRWVGTYGWDGESTTYRHTTAFNGWQPC